MGKWQYANHQMKAVSSCGHKQEFEATVGDKLRADQTFLS
jgi:hypothetical protein